MSKKIKEFMTPFSKLVTGKDGIGLDEANDIIWANKVNALKSEADAATDMLAYTNGQSKLKGSKKRLYEMTPEELNKALDELM